MAKKKYIINLSPKTWTILTAWFHVFVGGVLTTYLLDKTTSVKALLSAGIAAVAPLVYRYVNPSDTFPHPSPVLVAADETVKN